MNLPSTKKPSLYKGDYSAATVSALAGSGVAINSLGRVADTLAAFFRPLLRLRTLMRTFMPLVLLLPLPTVVIFLQRYGKSPAKTLSRPKNYLRICPNKSIF